MVKQYIPERGDVVWLNFDPQQGREIKKIRPALTISPLKYNIKTNLALFMPITSQIKGYPFEHEINCSNIKGAVLIDQIRSLDWHVRRAKFINKISAEIYEQVINKFRLLIEYHD